MTCGALKNQRSSRALMIDPKTDRRTPPTPTGKSYPVLFGPGTTSALLFVALHPGTLAANIHERLEVVRAGRNHNRLRKLQRDHLVVRGGQRYRFNPNVQHADKLLPFLRAFGRACGLGEETQTQGRMGQPLGRRTERTHSKLPHSLFWTKNRTNILLLIAALHEAYTLEMHYALGIDQTSLPARLRELEIEGLICHRSIRRIKVFSLNQEHPAAETLRSFLRTWSQTRSDIIAAANAALVRRVELSRKGRLGERRTMEELERNGIEAGKLIDGIQRFRPPRNTWKRLYGTFANRGWRNRRYHAQTLSYAKAEIRRRSAMLIS